MYESFYSANAHKTLFSSLCLIPVVGQEVNDQYRLIAQQLVLKASSVFAAHVEESRTPENLSVFAGEGTLIFIPFNCARECRESLHTLLSQQGKEVDWQVRSMPQVSVPGGVFSAFAGMSSWANAQFERHCRAYAGWGTEYLTFSCGDVHGATLCDGESSTTPNHTSLQALNTHFGLEPLAQYQHLRLDGEQMASYLSGVIRAVIRQELGNGALHIA